MEETVFDALRQREFVSVCLALLRRCGAPRVPDSAAASDVALLAWLSDPAINAAIDWPVDRILPTDRAPGDSGDVIAHENQDIWQAHMPSGEATTNERIEVCATPESGSGKGDPLAVLPLSELLVRVLMPPTGFRHVLRCELVADLGGIEVFPDRVVAGYTSGWKPVVVGQSWMRSGGHFYADDLGTCLAEIHHVGDGWERSIDVVTRTVPRAADAFSAYRDSGEWHVQRRWVPLEYR